jgi:tRNA (guanine37-N1)-methyltransferase
VLGNAESIVEESFSLSNDGLLEHPQYTRPAEFMGKSVPEVLLSGNHAEIEKWRKSASQERTKQRRPDLLGN